MDQPIDPDVSSPIEKVIVSPLSRRSVLRGAALAGAGIAGAGLAACARPLAPLWTPGPGRSIMPGAATASPLATATAMATNGHGHSPQPTGTAGATAPPNGWSEHDIEARRVVRRYLGNLAPALRGIYGDQVFGKLATILGAEDSYPELSMKPAFAQVPQLVLNDAVNPLTPTIENGVKVFRLTVDEISQPIDELKAPVAALGFNGQWPGPTIRVNQGDRVRAVFTNNLHETTGIHFHGVEFDDFFQDGVPWVTQVPIRPAESFAYEFVARNSGSHMYHSHHNATDQVGRGLLGAFIVEPAAAQFQYDREYIWISNDALGGFTINGHGFPAVVPALAAAGETLLVRFMNEGVMMHPWHSHGYKMRVVARDGWPLGSAAFDCDTLSVNPGERWDALITVDRPGVWAFHCHVLPHVEGHDGMFGMVTTLIVVPERAHVDAILAAIL
ncbi:MAG TPA: multicopper oxidase domain-containing protein [Candidatus Limnocylindrales bacterium]|nr:multicopper oxidase domain-containing protein [Candidatus Limnocylindrales bacterium]